MGLQVHFEIVSCSLQIAEPSAVKNMLLSKDGSFLCHVGDVSSKKF